MINTSRLSVRSTRPTEFRDITARLQQLVDGSGLLAGRVHLQSMHTTLGIAINENEPLLLADLEAMLHRLAPEAHGYLHDDFSRRAAVPFDEPANGHAHCRQALLMPSLTLLVDGGRLVLGRWQSVFAVELDGPRVREVAVQLEGDFEAPRSGNGRLVELELERQLLVDPPAVGGPMRRLVEAGGKRFRPHLVQMAAELGPDHDPLQAAILAAAIELIHTSTLVHDDYVDESPQRRGLPTVSALEGPALAIAVGDYYFAKATRLIAQLGHPAVTSTVAEAMEAICRSQIDDLEFRGTYPGDRSAYLNVVRGKTAALIAAACVAGAQLAGAPPETVERLRRYGDLVGIAFQMTDDVVDFSADSGKPLGQDVRERVPTLPLIYAAEHPAVGAELRALLAGQLSDPDLGRVVELVNASGALERVNTEAQGLVRDAVGTLDALDLNGLRDGFVELATSVVGRRT